MAYMATSDRNAYDRYYFNAHDRSGDVWLVAGLGIYPNLGVIDAFVAIRHGDHQVTIRSSDALDGHDRMAPAVGPIALEVIEPLEQIRLTCDAPDLGVEVDITWTGSCPVIDEMTYGPRRIMHLIQAGDEATVLSSKDPWRCVSCYSCANRCPRGIEITDLMADLRRLAIEKGYAEDKEAHFGQAFAETVQTHGRLFEPELLARYYLRVLDIVGLLKMVPLGIRMLLKGKLPFLPERVEHPEEIGKMDVVGSTTPQFATGVSARGRSGAKKALGGLVGGLLVALAANSVLVWSRGRGR